MALFVLYFVLVF